MRPVLVFLVVLATLRLLLVLAALEPAEERVVEVLDPAGVTWPYGPERPLFDREELYTGTAAEAMRRGLPIPASKFQFMAYGGGSLLTAWAARGVYSVFGESYLAFKILPLLVTLLGGLFWFAAIRRVFEERVAIAFAALYIFAPSTFVRTALIAKGDHPEAMAWIGFVLWAATGALHPGPRRRVWAAVAGIATGLGVFITYSTVPVLAGVFGLALLWTRVRPLQLWSWGVLGLGVGLIPWASALLTSGGSSLQVYGRTLGSAASEMGARLATVLNSGFFANYDLAGGLSIRTLAGLVFLIAVLTGWTGWVRRVVAQLRSGPTPEPVPGRDGRAVWIALALAGTVGHLAAFVVTAPDTASRYLMPVYPLLLLAVAGLVTGRRFSRILAGLVGVLGAVALFGALVQGAWTATRLPLSGTDWPLLGEVVGQKLAPDEITALPDDVRPHFWVGFGKKVFALAEREQWAEGVALAPEGEQGAVWEGIGIALVESSRAFAEGDYIRALPDPAGRALVRGMARYGEVAFADLAIQRPDINLAAAQGQMTGVPTPELTRSRARSVTTLVLHGAEVSSHAWRGIPEDMTRRAIGFATFAGVGGESVRRYPIRGYGFRDVPEDDPEVWSGLGTALGAELALTKLSGSARRDWVERIGDRVPSDVRARFQEAAVKRLEGN